MKQNTQENNTLKTKLQELLETKRETLKREVIEESLYYDLDDDIECFFRDLASHGCVSGKIDKLIYHTDTYAFYDKQYDKIEELRGQVSGKYR